MTRSSPEFFHAIKTWKTILLAVVAKAAHTHASEKRVFDKETADAGVGRLALILRVVDDPFIDRLPGILAAPDIKINRQAVELEELRTALDEIVCPLNDGHANRSGKSTRREGGREIGEDFSMSLQGKMNPCLA